MLRERLDLDEDNDLETLCLPSEKMIIQAKENSTYRNKLGYVIITLKWLIWKIKILNIIAYYYNWELSKILGTS